MKKALPYLLFILASCHSKESKPGQETTTTPVASKTKEASKIRFDFTAIGEHDLKDINVSASLFNDGIDTVYFLTSTCYGEQYSLWYDTTKFILSPLISCNASFPIIEKIAPKSRHDFKTHFTSKTGSTKIRLGFDFFEVDKWFDLRKTNLTQIHNRPPDKQNILLAEEKRID